MPLFRVDEAPPFNYTGVDFAGPLFVKQVNNVPNKVWICLLTCCVTRAVHLDLVNDLSTPSFIRCLKRFTARRGVPKKMLSDNGKTFKGAARMLRSIVSQEDTQRYLSGMSIKWDFNLPKAPWWGGVFERLIRSTKRCLRKVLGQAKLTLDELLTAVVEVEAVLNSRPLTYVSMDDVEEPLTPSHFLNGRRIWSLPDHTCHGREKDPESGPAVLTKRMRHLHHLLDQFWIRWRKEYLLELRESHRHHHGSNHPSEVSVGDVVMVHSTDQPRGFWKLGRVKKVLVGRDSKVRGAVVQVVGRGRQATTLHRPIQRLYPLEVSHMDLGATSSDSRGQRFVSSNPTTSEDDTPSNESVLPPRQPRRAALEARDRIIAQTLQD